MTPEEAVEELDRIDMQYDAEVGHILADNILIEFVPPEVAEAWRKIKKWYS